MDAQGVDCDAGVRVPVVVPLLSGGTSGREPGARRGPSASRLVAWLAVAVIGAIVAFLVGIAHVDHTRCGNGGECDLAPLEVVVWAAGAIVLTLLAATVDVVLQRRRTRPARVS